MSADHHAERMALYLVKLRPYLTHGQQTKVDELVGDYRRSQRKATAVQAGLAQNTMFAEIEPPTVPYQRQDTSIEAAGQIAGQVIAIRERVFRAISEKPDTDQGLSIRLRMAENTVRPRRVELEKAGRVIDSGGRRRSTSGRKAIVWEIRR